jgi:HSP20 family protein
MDKPQKKSEASHEITPFWRTGWSDLDRVFDNFRRDFERTLSSFPAISFPSLPTSSMSCDVMDEGDKYVINADMPGIQKEDVKLNVTDNAVEISAQHKEEEEEKKKNYVRKERKEISYYRTLHIPEKVDSSKAKAKMNNGILNVEIPKTTPTPKPKSTSIPVQ